MLSVSKAPGVGFKLRQQLRGYATVSSGKLKLPTKSRAFCIFRSFLDVI